LIYYYTSLNAKQLIRLWTKLGFDTVGHLPKAFNHPEKDYVDALVMYKWLETSQSRGTETL
jgi:hypothetical protein